MLHMRSLQRAQMALTGFSRRYAALGDGTVARWPLSRALSALNGHSHGRYTQLCSFPRVDLHDGAQHLRVDNCRLCGTKWPLLGRRIRPTRSTPRCGLIPRAHFGEVSQPLIVAKAAA